MDRPRSVFDAIGAGEVEALARMFDERPGLMAGGGDPNWLSWAVQADQLETVRLLLDWGADANRMDPSGWSALGHACMRGGKVEILKLLLERGVDPSAPNIHGDSAIHWAGASDSETVRVLLRDSRVRVDERGQGGRTALHSACHLGFVEVARVLLLEGGANHTMVNNRGKTPIAAIDRGSLIVRNPQEYRACAELMEWFEGELERAYWLAKVRQVEDDREAIQQAPSKAKAGTAEEAQRAREEAAGAWVRGRVERGVALPTVQMVGGEQQQPEEEACRSGEGQGKGEVMRAVVEHVVWVMKEDPFLMLLQLMRLR